jgi:hypothetical protein
VLGQPVQTSSFPGFAALLVAAAILACVDASVDAPRREPVRNVSAVREPIESAGRVRRGSTTPETADSAAAATRGSMVAANVIGRRLLSIQIAGLSREQRERIALPIEIGSLVTADTQREIAAAIARVGAPLSADMFAVPGGAAIVIGGATK